MFYSKKNKKESKNESQSFKYLSKQIFGLAVPVTLGGLIAPITNMVDSLLVVNLLMMSGFSTGISTTLLGLQAGVVEPLLNIPGIIAVSISTAILPSISSFSAENSKEKIKNMIEKAFQISLCISLACAICYVIFGGQILNFLYGSSFDNDDLAIATKLLFLGSINIIFLSLVQITAGTLQGLGYSKVPVKSLLIGCGIKIVLDCILIPIKAINIYGTIISGAICYLVVFILNYSKIKKLVGVSVKESFFYISILECFVCLFAFFGNVLCRMVFGETLSLIVAGTVTVCVFFVTYYVFFMYDKHFEDFEEKRLS